MSAPEVRTRAQLVAADGDLVAVHGRYETRMRPVRGTPKHPRPLDRAVIVLEDETAVWLESLDDPASIRPARERDELDGEPVVARGIAHEIMPAAGASPLVPCLSTVRDLRRLR